MAENNDFIRWGFQSAIDRYYQMVRRRMGLPDTLESIEEVRSMPREELYKYLLAGEVIRLEEFQSLLKYYEREDKESEGNIVN